MMKAADILACVVMALGSATAIFFVAVVGQVKTWPETIKFILAMIFLLSMTVAGIELMNEALKDEGIAWIRHF